MQPTAAQDPTDLLASPLVLADLLDGTSLEEVLGSFYALFRLPVRILNERGAHLARTLRQSALNEYLGELPGAAKRLGEEHLALRVGDLGEGGERLHRAFTGASYHVGAIGHDGRSIGRFILGPFLTPEAGDVPHELLASDPNLDAARVRELLQALPRIREDTVKAIARHLAVTLDALMFSGYRAKLSEDMHLSSVQENGRYLSEAGRQLRAHELRGEESQRLQGKLLGAISAELREPSSRLLEQASSVAASSSPEHRALAASVLQESQRLVDLAERLLQLSNVQSGFELQKQEIDPAVLLERTRVALRSSTASDARVQVSLESGLPRLWADPGRLLHALRLLGEDALAVEHDSAISLEARRARGGPGREPGDLDGLVLMGTPPEALEFRIADHGPHVPECERGRIFEAFYELGAESRRGSRSGLRLAVVKRLIEAHEGNVRIEDNFPCGAVFVVTLPLLVPGVGS